MTKCKCKSCGKTWDKGDQDDNETLCLRCERELEHETRDWVEMEYE